MQCWKRMPKRDEATQLLSAFTCVFALHFTCLVSTLIELTKVITISSDIIPIWHEKIRRNSLFEVKYEFEYIRILSAYSNSKFICEYKFQYIRIRNFSKIFENIWKQNIGHMGQKLNSKCIYLGSWVC